jgi:site-specific DNA recombinase
LSPFNNKEKRLVNEVAIYLRKSRGDEDKDLLKHKDILIELCKDKDWKYVIYSEIGQSDSIEFRPKMKELLNDIANDMFDAVLVVDYDRLSRGGKEDQAVIERTIRDSNTLIITPQKVYDLEDESDALLSDFQGLLARFEYNQIKKRFRRGKKIGAKYGNWTNGPAPFPYVYDHQTKSLKVNKDQWPLYNEIKESVLKGKSLYSIAVALNKKGYRTNKGYKFSDTAIYRLVTNEVHLGRVIHGKTSGSGHLKKKVAPLKINDRSEWIICENAHDAVLTEDEFNKIQELLKRNKRTPTKARASIHPFSGLIRCGKCGSSLSFKVQRRNGKHQTYLRNCIKKDWMGGSCSNPGLRLDLFYSAIFEKLQQYEQELVKVDNSSSKKQVEKQLELLKQQEKELKKHEASLNRIKELYEDGDYSREEYNSRRDERQEQIRQLKIEIEQTKKSKDYYENLQTEDRLQHLRSLKLLWDGIYNEDGSQNEDGAKAANLVLKQIIDRITYIRDRDEVTLEVEFL